jgi:hypothetical protein
MRIHAKENLAGASEDRRVNSRRCCGHCCLTRALLGTTDALTARGLVVTPAHTEPFWVPGSGAAVYRNLRRFLGEVCDQPEAWDEVRIAVLDLPGKSHFEVMVTLQAGRRARVLTHRIPRYDPATLARGFPEGLSRPKT